MIKIFIPGNVASSKNSKQWTGKFLISSKTVRNYEKATDGLWLANCNEFRLSVVGKPNPLRVHFKFYRDSRRRFDYHNALQLAADKMVEFGWIEDDSADYFLPVFEPYEYNKSRPGVEIWAE